MAEPARRRLRELVGVDRLEASNCAMRWGFPRPILVYELVLGHWFAWGALGVFWLVPEPETALFGLHIATAPGSRLTEDCREFERLLLVIGDLLGAEGVYAQPIPGTPSERIIRRLMWRLGWRQQGLRWYLSLRAGGEVGNEAEEGPQGPGADPAWG